MANTAERTAVAIVCLAMIGSCAGAALAAAAARALEIAPLLPALIGVVVGATAACVWQRRRLAQRLPAELDGWFARRRRLRWLWIAAAILAVVNTARLCLFVADPTQVWASAFPPVPESARHQCLGAYVRAGELAADHRANLWNPDDYQVGTDINGLTSYLGDPYEYPPTFAVIPRAVVELTNDYQLIRALWFGISAVGFWLAFLALAAWIGGRAGATALLLAPAIAISFPVTIGLQFGQAHIVVVAAAIGAMVAFVRGRTLTGAALLGFAITTKIFPGLLLVHLAIRRQWRAIAVTLLVVGVWTAIATIVLGPSTIAAFVTEHLPRMASGEAFAHAEQNPDNHSLYGVAFKLSALGVADTGRAFGSALALGWGILAVILAAVGSRRGGDRARDAVVWLAILCLATLQSPYAPSYTAIGTLWLLAVAVGVAPRRWLTIVVAICWVLLQGAPPMGSPVGDYIASLPSQLATIAIAVIAVWPRRADAG